MSQRNFLRKQVMEYRELNGLRKGFRVSAIVNNQAEQGTVKWIGMIKGTIYIGIQFERPVGNQFPETHGAPPFPCSVAHSRFVLPEDVKRGLTIMDRHPQLHRLQDDDYLLSDDAYLCLGAGNPPRGNTVTRYITNLSNGSDISEDESQFVSTSSSITTSSGEPLLKEFDEGNSVFYELCSQAKRAVKEWHARYDELPIHCRFDDCAALSLSLEKLKSFRGEVEGKILSYLERCKEEMEAVMRYPGLLPSEERAMSHELQDAEQSYCNLDQEICSEIDNLEHFTSTYQSLQDLVQERTSRFAVIKTRLIQVERNLVKDEIALCLRIKGLQSILSVLERDHDSGENCEVTRLLSEIQLYDYMDLRRVLSQTKDLILGEKQLLEEVRTKRALLLEAKESYKVFIVRCSKFQSWYADYMRRLSETKVTGLDFDEQHATLVKEREDKRVDFIEILTCARNLRASIFDSSAVDNKIEALQDDWKLLVEKVYRARSRKTM